MCELGWKSLGVLELTALPSIDEERWVPWVREADVLLVNGGDALYLCHWMRQSGLADLLPSLRETVWVGLSAGSMVMTPRIGEDFVGWKPPTGGDSTLGIVDFSIFPHVDHEDLPENTMADAERWAAGIAGPAYAIDDETAIKVTDGAVESSPRGTGDCSPLDARLGQRAVVESASACSFNVDHVPLNVSDRARDRLVPGRAWAAAAQSADRGRRARLSWSARAAIRIVPGAATVRAP